MTTLTQTGLHRIGLAGTSLFAAALLVAGAVHAEPAHIYKGGADAGSLPVQSQPDAAASILSFRDGFATPAKGAADATDSFRHTSFRHISRDGAGNTAEDRGDDN